VAGHGRLRPAQVVRQRRDVARLLRQRIENQDALRSRPPPGNMRACNWFSSSSGSAAIVTLPSGYQCMRLCAYGRKYKHLRIIRGETDVIGIEVTDVTSELRHEEAYGVQLSCGTARAAAHFYSPRSWATSSRRRGRLSKSTKTICCHVPSVRRPAANGTVSDGPSSAARTWLWPLPSPQRALCA
jgi:hypothetical protein